ncbi:MAG TPA: nuclear transport factor 2 family protein [Gaiellaceae bacterium]|nr:nuclear transport factor 2 family protein [Gaiellaceae bacterium]
MDVRAWLAAYGRAWETGDADAAAALFTADALYRSHPFREAHAGTAGIRAYWAQATATQEGVDVRFGDPIVAGARVAVEWWAVMRDGAEDVTLPGCLLLRFAPDGRCAELREYWHVHPGRHAPPPGWGR